MGKREGKDKLKVQGQKENSGKAAKKTSKSLEHWILIIVRLFNNLFQKIVIVCGYRSFSY